MSGIRKFFERLIPEPRGPKWSYRVVPMSHRFYFKRLCPHCHATLIYSAFGWEHDAKTGLWMATEIESDCGNMPDFESDLWDSWFVRHSRHPYVYQLPVDVFALNEIQKYYRFYHS